MREDTEYDDDGPPLWDKARGAALLGTRVLVGFTYAGPTWERLEQMHGIVTVSDRDQGIEITLEGAKLGEKIWLPPDLDAFTPASPGEYRLRGTGEIVVDPDYFATWVINAPQN